MIRIDITWGGFARIPYSQKNLSKASVGDTGRVVNEVSPSPSLKGATLPPSGYSRFSPSQRELTLLSSAQIDWMPVFLLDCSQVNREGYRCLV
jgi:hypothetical protein